jgi:hypothetical protein
MRRRQGLFIVLVIVLGIGLVAFTGTVGADEEEPNDDFDEAQPISEGNISGEIVDGESDFFEIQANTTDAVQVSLEDAQPNDLALRVYNSEQEEIVGQSACCSVPGPLTKKLSETGTYYIEVAGTSEQKTTNYTLDYDRITPAENDPFAPNSNFSNAAPVNEGFHDAKLWGGESDFYEIQANTTDAIQVNLEDAQPNDLALRVYNSDREEIVGQFTCCSVPGPLNKKLSETGTYYIKVAGTSEQKTTAYTLDYDRITPAENDPFAPNSNFSDAAPVNEGFHDAKLWGGESDFYEIQANTTDAIQVNLEDAQPNDLALRVYNSEQEEIVGQSTCCSVPGPLTKKIPETGTYYIEVEGTSEQKTTEYTLDYDKITPPENDQFAPNSNFSAAALLTQEFNDAKIWGGESDFYRVALTANETIEVNVENAQPNDLALRVYNSDEEEIASQSTCCGVPGPLIETVPETGTYYIEVEGTSEQKTTEYTLDSNKSNNDSDGDTIPDIIDEAPNEPEDFDGCRDEDGVPDPSPCPLVEDPPQDLDGNGLYEDIDGDGAFDIFDVQALFNEFDSDAAQLNPGLYNFKGAESPEEVTLLDVQGLFEELVAQD